LLLLLLLLVVATLLGTVVPVVPVTPHPFYLIPKERESTFFEKAGEGDALLTTLPLVGAEVVVVVVVVGTLFALFARLAWATLLLLLLFSTTITPARKRSRAGTILRGRC
jgi:hypothetical protein